MGYAIHITRANAWSESEDAPIALDEWRRAIATDPTLDPNADDETAACWKGHSGAFEIPVFYWVRGRIVSERPDDQTIGKAVAVARTLGARVFGDDGQTYERESTVPAGESRPPLTDSQKLLRDAMNRGWFHRGWIRRGVLPRPIRLTVHTLDGRTYFLIVVYRNGPLRDVDVHTPIDIVRLSSGATVEPYTFLGRTVGFRIQANGGAQIAVRVKAAETWIRWLRHPEQGVELPIT